MKNINKTIKNKSSKATNSSTILLSKLSDSALYKLCKEYGKNTRKWAREFGFLLPEVYKRRLYRKYGCTSIHMFAGKLSGMSREVTDRILNLNHKLKDMPTLWNELKKYGWSKLEVIARVATIKTENFWIDKLRKTPRQVLIEYIREWIAKKEKIESKKNLFDFVTNGDDTNGNSSLEKPKINKAPNFGYEDFETVNCETKDIDSRENNKTIAAGTWKRLKFKVDNETEFEFRKYKQNLEKKRKEALTMGETLKTLLAKVKELKAALEASGKITIPKNQITEDYENKSLVTTTSGNPINIKPTNPINNITTTTSGNPINIKPTNPHSTTRYISKKLKESVIQKYREKCAIPNCNHPYFEIHHPERFSYNHSHAHLYPLCKIHHQAAHSGLIKNENKPIEKWRFDFQEKNSALKSEYLCYLSASQYSESISKAYQLLEKEKIDARVRSYWIA